MSEAPNTQVVKDAYAAFQRGDINGILELLDESVVWEGVKGTEGVMKTAGVRTGRPAIREFFSQVNETIAFESFELRNGKVVRFREFTDSAALVGAFNIMATA